MRWLAEHLDHHDRYAGVVLEALDPNVNDVSESILFAEQQPFLHNLSGQDHAAAARERAAYFRRDEVEQRAFIVLREARRLNAPPTGSDRLDWLHQVALLGGVELLHAEPTVPGTGSKLERVTRERPAPYAVLDALAELADKMGHKLLLGERGGEKIFGSEPPTLGEVFAVIVDRDAVDGH
jgi:hypothetical protein